MSEHIFCTHATCRFLPSDGQFLLCVYVLLCNATHLALEGLYSCSYQRKVGLPMQYEKDLLVHTQREAASTHSFNHLGRSEFMVHD